MRTSRNITRLLPLFLAFTLVPVVIVLVSWAFSEVVRHLTTDTPYPYDDQLIESIRREERIASFDASLKWSIMAEEKWFRLIDEVWTSAKSSDPNESKRGWRTLKKIRRMRDGAAGLDFCRRCWFECRDDPLLFYLAYRSGIAEAVDYYDMAAFYDNGAYSWDKISDQEVMRVLYLAKKNIKEYNKSNHIADTFAERKVQEFIDARVRIFGRI
jgi:hypothetical protein